MDKISIVVHGGAGADSDFIKKNKDGYEQSLREAVETGYAILEEGGRALDAVEAAVNYLEDNPLFNAGRGSALNEKGEVAMCSSIMDGSNLQSGAVAIIRNVKNPVTLARAVLEKTNHIYLGSEGALEFAKEIGVSLEPDSYFITDYQFETYQSKRKEERDNGQEAALEQATKRMHGTVGAVACDQHGNIAAATSTGGTEYEKAGRIGDSSMVGIGTYADNKTCAVSTTGDGEYLIQHVGARTIAALVDYKGMSLKEACYYFMHDMCKDVKGDMGLIAVDKEGNIAFEFNSDRMHRGWKGTDKALGVAIYAQ